MDFQSPQCYFEGDLCLLRYLAAVQLFRSAKIKLLRGGRDLLWRDGGVSVVDEGVAGGSVEDVVGVER